MENKCGILGLEAYFPCTYIEQEDLEAANNVSKGKYTIGLGQTAMAFTGDREDINSISLSVVSSLLKKYNIDPKQVGRLEVGTETLIDKSKSTKTVLMELFASSGNHDIEGVTCTNACYGGTAALLNALMWCDSSSWDGRYAIVVAADIAVYANGPARPTGGCGAIAMLIGRDAPLVIDLKTRATHATNVWDFFKPHMDSEYPVVDGALSEACYLTALDGCYTKFLEKQKESNNHEKEKQGNGGGGWLAGSVFGGFSSTSGSEVSGSSITGVESVDYFLFHSPYNKLVQKSFARILYLDIRNKRQLCSSIDTSEVKQWMDTPLTESQRDKGLEGKMKIVSKPYYESKVSPGCEASKLIGNTYTASVYLNLCWLVSEHGAKLAGKNVVLFSYGSGAMATMMSLQPNAKITHDGKFSLAAMATNLNLATRLAERSKREPTDLDAAMTSREAVDIATRPFYPTYSTHSMPLGTYYLRYINEKHQRVYAQKTSQESPIGSPPRANAADIDGETGRVRSITEELNMTSMTTMQLAGLSPEEENGQNQNQGRNGDGVTTSTPGAPPSLSRNKTYVWASGRPNVRVVVTGVSAALPGRDAKVFMPGVNNIRRIISGVNCITPIPEGVKDSMLEKNVVLLKKNKETGKNTRVPVDSHEDNVNLCASLGDFDLTEYGVTQSIAATMDVSVQVAVAAGLEALKDAGIVTGDPSTGGWVLPESMQATTGVVYATSFPALDTAIAEVSRFFKTKMAGSQHLETIVQNLRTKLEARLEKGETLGEESEKALQALAAQAASYPQEHGGKGEELSYEFDRKFLFRVLVLGNAQLAQIIKAKGPNMQTNAACAGSTQAVALAFDMIQVGRAERMIVVAGDNAASDTLMPWLGNGFRALGAATICSQIELASIPFDKRRSGMILGAGGIGIVLESEDGANRRYALASKSGLSLRPAAFKCRLLGTLYSNSAYHGASLDKEHIAMEMERFVVSVEKEQGISRVDIAKYGVYFSHETSTYASPTSSCASNELYGLRKVFGEHFKDMLILNTKGFTGHPMGVSFEDVVAAEVLVSGMVPPIANYNAESQVDPSLGSDLKLSRGGAYPCKYAMRFAAGFGSQIALALYGAANSI